MIIKYEFVDGDVIEVETSEEIAEAIKEFEKEEHADNERNRVHNHSIESAKYEGKVYEYQDPALRRLEIAESKRTRRTRRILKRGFSRLTEKQRKRVLLLIKGMSIREISKYEGTDFKTVWESIESARKKFN